MNRISTYLLVILFIVLGGCSSDPNNPNGQYNTESPGPITLVIHGGAGDGLTPENFDQKEQDAFNQKLTEALQAGYKILEKGGSSCEAVMAAITIMEDSPLFNAGKGAVLTADGNCELDASIMDGSKPDAGAVAGVTNIKNPVKAAYAVMKNSPHVMLAGKGAEQFAIEQGLDTVSADYFLNERTRKQREEILKKKEFGTVGAVALDANGNICASTSTGGINGKNWNRIGDAPIIGAGTYANNNTCGVSCTGMGEVYIRSVAAYDIAAQIEYQGKFPVEASQATLDKIESMGGIGGIIILDKYGNVAMPFNTKGMLRGYIQNGEPNVKIFRD